MQNMLTHDALFTLNNKSDKTNNNIQELQTSEKVPVNLFKSVDFPTEGKPTRPTLESPLFVTSNPSPAPPPPFDAGVRISLRSLASFA